MQGLLVKLLLVLLGGKVAYDKLPEVAQGIVDNAAGPATTTLLAGTLEISAGVLDVFGYIMFVAFILGSKKGGERVAIIWPLSIILEAVSYKLWNY